MLIRLWNSKQDQWDLEEVVVPGKPATGPSDEYIVIENSAVEPDENGNFTSKDYTKDQINAVHAFAIARLTIHMWQIGLGKKIHWDNVPGIKDKRLKIVINGVLSDASYRPTENTIFLGTYYPSKIPTCMSLDIISHETTHAIFEYIRPGTQDSGNVDVIALIEGWADLSPIFLQLIDPTLFNQIKRVTNKTFVGVNNLSEFAEGYMHKNKGIRSALDKRIKNPNNPCSVSSPLINLVYTSILNQLLKPGYCDTFVRNFESQFKELLIYIPSESLSYSAYYEKIKSALTNKEDLLKIKQ